MLPWCEVSLSLECNRHEVGYGGQWRPPNVRTHIRGHHSCLLSWGPPCPALPQAAAPGICPLSCTLTPTPFSFMDRQLPAHSRGFRGRLAWPESPAPPMAAWRGPGRLTDRETEAGRDARRPRGGGLGAGVSEHGPFKPLPHGRLLM